MVPCVVYCGNALKWNVSYTTPWPENAASPWIRTLITFAYKYIVRVNKLVIDDNGKPAWSLRLAWLSWLSSTLPYMALFV